MQETGHALSRIRDQTATDLMFVCALGTSYAILTAIPVAQDATPEAQQVETWRMVGYAFFACLIVRLAV